MGFFDGERGEQDERYAHLEERGWKHLPQSGTLVTPHPAPGSQARMSQDAPSGPRRGDNVEVFTSTPDGVGEWRSGLRAFTSVTVGRDGGPYQGKPVVWVGWEARFSANEGDEWPAEYVRTVDRTVRFSGDPDPRLIRTVTDLAEFRYDETQARGYHGRWTEMGRGDDKDRVYPARVAARSKDTSQEPTTGTEMLPQALRNVNPKHSAAQLKVLEETYGVTFEQMVQRQVDLWNSMPVERAEAYGQWYYEAHDMASDWTKIYKGSTVSMNADVIASLSPQARWGEDHLPSTQFDASNQVYAQKVMDMVFLDGDVEYTITSERAAELNHPDIKAHLRFDVANYQGIEKKFHGKSFVGTFKAKDLPADVLALTEGKPNAALTDRVAVAIMLARGYDADMELSNKGDKTAKLLNGPKIRSFANNIRNPWLSEETTVDVHMIAASMDNIGLQDVDIAKLQMGKDGFYTVFDGVLREAAKRVGVQGHALQAANWMRWSRELHDLHGVDKRTAKEAGARFRKGTAKGEAKDWTFENYSLAREEGLKALAEWRAKKREG